jgi:hypothetical protein
MRLQSIALLCCIVIGIGAQSTAQIARNRLVVAVGSDELLFADLQDLLQRASELNSGIPAHYVDDSLWLKGAHGVVTPIQFTDGSKWGVKISSLAVNNRYEAQMMYRGISASRAIKTFCPAIPIPQIHGSLSFSKSGLLVYYFMDWIDGDPIVCTNPQRIDGPVLDSSGNVHPLLELTFPSKSLPQFAEFCYNISTCAISDEESKVSARHDTN